MEDCCINCCHNGSKKTDQDEVTKYCFFNANLVYEAVSGDVDCVLSNNIELCSMENTNLNCMNFKKYFD